MNIQDPLVSVEWLKAHLESPNLKIVDGTWIPDWVAPQGTAKLKYQEKHIPSAVYFDIDEICDKSSYLPHMLPSEEVFSNEVGKLGISESDHVIVYDDNNYMASARVWWMFRAMGHTDVQVLDGGFAEWDLEYGEIVERETQQVSNCKYKAQFKTDLVESTVTILNDYNNPSLQIFDARPDGRFRGVEPEPRDNLSSGHIPNSINIPHNNLIDSKGKIRKSKELEGIFGDLTERIICTCGSGVSAAVLALALARLGKFNVSVYDGSWCAWAHNSQHPIAVGSS